MRFGTLTALDLSGVRPRRHSDGTYHHACVACGHAARSGDWHTECANPACSHVVFSPLDILAARFGCGHSKAVRLLNSQLRRDTLPVEAGILETARRRVMDCWLRCCRDNGTTLEAANKRDTLRAKGFMILPSQTGVTIVSAATIQKLVKLALLTGADVPDAMLQQPPSYAIAYAVQSVPHTIDRIVITTGGVREWHIVWHAKRVGLVGLINSPDNRHRLLASGYREALALQLRLTDIGLQQEVAAVFIDPASETTREEWRPDLCQLTSVVGKLSDLATFAAFHDTFPMAADCVMSQHRESMFSPAAGPVAVAWPVMRRSYLAAVIGRGKRELSSESVSALELSGPSREEVAWLVQRFREQGRLELSEAVKRHMDNRVIATDHRVKVRETASDYVSTYGATTTNITNFALRFSSNLFFRDSADVFHLATLVFGKTSVEIALGSHTIDNARELQKAIRHQLILGRSTHAPEQLPTVIDTLALTRYVIPYFKTQIAELPPQEGSCSMGWSNDRAMFVGPGLRITLEGREYGPVARHPGVTSLRHFAPTADWNVGFSEDLPTPARDLVAMVLASCVRFFVKSNTRPVCIHHSPEARHLLTTMFAALGQTEIFELNPNVRDQSGAQGVRGYPFLVTGYNAAQAMNARFGHLLLTDTGYSVAGEVSQEDAEAAGRSLQYGLARVAEWCLATGAETFSEIPALHYNSSLLREGKWLIENVCELQPWEVSDLGLAHLEALLAQIPAADTGKRLALQDGTVLTADLSGLQWDRDKVREDLRALHSRCDGEGDSLVMGAVEVMPALELYYGRPAEVAVVL